MTRHLPAPFAHQNHTLEAELEPRFATRTPSLEPKAEASQKDAGNGRLARDPQIIYQLDNYHGKNIDKYPIFIVLKNIGDIYRYSQKYRKYRIFFLLRKAGCIVFRGRLHTLHRNKISVKYHRKKISPILSIFRKNIDNIS
jgi:hypothetical protein